MRNRPSRSPVLSERTSHAQYGLTRRPIRTRGGRSLQNAAAEHAPARPQAALVHAGPRRRLAGDGGSVLHKPPRNGGINGGIWPSTVRKWRDFLAGFSLRPSRNSGIFWREIIEIKVLDVVWGSLAPQAQFFCFPTPSTTLGSGFRASKHSKTFQIHHNK